MIIDITRLLAVVILIQVILGLLRTEALNSVNGLEMWPNLTTFTLLSNTSEERSTLLCSENGPIQWYFKKYDGTLQIKKNSSIAVFPKDSNISTHIALLSLKKATYLDTGNYICSKSIESEYYKEIYVFVPHETHLLAIPEDFKLQYDISKGNKFIGQFRPTSQDVNVTITATKMNKWTCLPEKFKCNIGHCIPKKFVCDGLNDCGDNSHEDKHMCSTKWTCLPETFKCNIGKCILVKNICDGVNDCGDNSDEDKDMCTEWTCLPETFKCNIGLCIPKKFVCDGVNDCGDNSDEDKDMCTNRTCSPEKPFKCNIGKCILEKYVCDGDNDCGDNSDEDKDMCTNRTCSPENPFKCNIGKYILEKYVCDGDNDCGDNSDEDKDMCTNRTCSPEKPFKCNIGKCILEKYVCDGDNDCGDNSDEDKDMCTNRTCSPENPFKCNIGKCIPEIDVCDGVNDCDDNSDEDEDMCMKLFITSQTIVDEKKGFVLNAIIFFNGNNISFAASKNNTTDIRKVRDPLESWLHINDSYTGHATDGQNLTLNCSLEHRINLIYLLKWTVPDTLKDKTQHIKIGKYTDRSILLNIQNVSIEYVGNYHCTALMTNGRNYTKTYKLNAYRLDVNYLNLKIEDGINKKIRPAGYEDEQWTIEISSNQNTSLLWISPNGKLLKTKSGNKCVKNNYCISELILTNLQLSDSGSYRLATYNGKMSKEIEVMLFVEEKPKVTFVKEFNLIRPYFEIGKIYTFEFYISGYPLPHVTWTFKKCKNYPKCEEARHVEKNDTNYEKIQVTATIVKLIITLNITDTGIIICNASNILGTYTKQYTVLAIVADTKNLFEKKKVCFLDNDKINEDQQFGVFPFCTILTLFIIILIIVCAIMLKKKKIIKNKLALIEKYNSEKKAVKDEFPNMNILFRWDFPPDKLKLGKRLGSGQFGVVYKAKAIGLNDENTVTDVAVKTINPNTDSGCLKILESELKIMAHVGYHLNIVKLLGVCIGTSETIDIKLMVMVEYCRYGNVHQYILKHRDCFTDQFKSDGCSNSTTDSTPNMKICSDDFMNAHNSESALRPNHQGDRTIINIESLHTFELLSWSYQVAKGMDYLASKKIIHGDLATRNVLLAEENIVKICDFGLARITSDDEIYQKKSKKCLLPFRWLAIESIRDRIFSTQSDVWSFGIVLWEMFSLSATPYANLQPYEIYNKLIDGYRLEEPRYANSQLYSIMLNCWETEPMKRPTFNDLANRLGDILQDVTKTDYANLTDHYKNTDNETLPSTNLLTTPTYSNCPITAKIHKAAQDNCPEP